MGSKYKFKKVRLGIPLLFLLLLWVPNQSSGQSKKYQSPVYTYSTLPKNSELSAATNINNVLGANGNNNDGNGLTIGQQWGNPIAEESQSIYSYEMYPKYQVPKLSSGQNNKKCVYTASGMKCKRRRDGGMDSYVAAAGSSASYGASSTYGTSGEGWGSADYEDDGKEGDLTGLIGLLGLKGLKSLVPFKAAILPFLPFLPLLLPLLLLLPILLPFLLILPILPLFLLLLLLPIPTICQPDGTCFFIGRSGSFTRNLLKEKNLFPSTTNVSRMIKDLLYNEECVERLTCELGKKSNGFKASWINRILEHLPNAEKFTSRVKRGLESGMKEESSERDKLHEGQENSANICSKFICTTNSINIKSPTKSS